MEQEFKVTCVGCRRECEMAAKINGSEVVEVTGHTCEWGENYAREEAAAYIEKSSK